MDPVFDSGRSQAYYKYYWLFSFFPKKVIWLTDRDTRSFRVRDTLYPLDRKGSSRFWNRAGDKLVQVGNAFSPLLPESVLTQ